jgi:hypothetical protein
MEPISRLLKSKIEDGTIELIKIFDTPNKLARSSKLENIKENVISELENADVKIADRYAKFILRLINVSEDVIRPILILPINKFNVFGCPNSTDIDIAYVVDDQFLIETARNGFAKIDFVDLQTKLTALGYINVTPDNLDINLVCIDSRGNLSTALKGSKETQNIIYYTFHLHRQMYERLFDRTVTIEMMDKIKATSKCVLDKLEHLLSVYEYDQEYENRISAYNSGSRIDYVRNLLLKKYDKFDRDVTTKKYFDAMKTIVMKLIQIVLEYNSIYKYTKIELAEEIEKLIPDSKDNSMYFLFRGTMGVRNPKFFKTLTMLYSEIVNCVISEFDWHNVPFDTSINATILPDDIITEFFKSPLEPTDEFCKFYEKYFVSHSINKMFPIKTMNTDLLTPTFMEHVVMADKRSTEWTELLAFYTCGMNSSYKGLVLDESIHPAKRYYNLIRCAIVKLTIIQTIELEILQKVIGEKYIVLGKVVVGLIVEKLGKVGGYGCAPDLLIVVIDKEYGKKKVIPVEIKCVPKKFNDSKEIYRAIKLARLQLNTISVILPEEVEKFGILILVTLTDGIFEPQITKITI